MEKYKQLREAAEAQAEAAHEAQVRAAQEAVRQLIAQNRPNVERREQLLSEKLDKKRQKEVSCRLRLAVDLLCIDCSWCRRYFIVL